MGPFICPSKGNMFILIIIDSLTKFVWLYPVSNKSNQTLLQYIKLLVLNHGLLRRIISDRGTCFTSKAFKDYYIAVGTQHSLISIRHPQANGQVE